MSTAVFPELTLEDTEPGRLPIGESPLLSNPRLLQLPREMGWRWIARGREVRDGAVSASITELMRRHDLAGYNRAKRTLVLSVYWEAWFEVNLSAKLLRVLADGDWELEVDPYTTDHDALENAQIVASVESSHESIVTFTGVEWEARMENAVLASLADLARAQRPKTLVLRCSGDVPIVLPGSHISASSVAALAATETALRLELA